MACCDLAISSRVNSHTFCMQSAKDLARAFANRSQVEKVDRSTGSKLIHGRWLLLDRNGGIFIKVEVLKLPANSAIGSKHTQLS